ncbi:MAG: hypothetical protein IT317_06395, partial [Anaerolineales bacterium]|nr:hypothetical protein [Anaerolineales bacterium]
TLIAAPAGFGKTTLLSDWLAHSQRAVAWLSLDEHDNDLARFLTYVIAALQTVDASLGTEALDLLGASRPLPAEMILTPLINAVAGRSQEIVLVLDDYHLIETPRIHEALGFLLDHLPRQLHVALSSRADPPLPLPRLRARGALTELRAADLRFTPDEATSFLNQLMGLNLAADNIAALEARTEGWIAGLQMAALSMQGREDVDGFVQAFTGSHRYIIDYLVEEVLQRQPEDVRSFLLQTCILNQLTGPLCETVTGQLDGSGRLQALERANLFVVPLDDQREWYRYHHLFADVLRARLRETHPEQLPELHRRASEWYAQREQPIEAVQHALAADDFARAASLMELAWTAVSRSRQDATLRAWVKALPDDLIRRRPVLSAWFATALLLGGELEQVERRLEDAERWLGPAANEPVVASADEFRRLPVTLAIGRAGLAQVRGDIAATIHYAQQAFASVAPSDHLGRAGAAGFLGLALWARGDLTAAERTFAESVTSMHLSGNLADALSGTIGLAQMQIGRGRLHEARRTLDQAGQLAAAQGSPVPRATADLLVTLSELDCEQNHLEAAEAHLQQSKALGERASLPENRDRWPVAMARLHAARGDFDSALKALDEAERLHVHGFFPDARPIGALRARIWITQGRLAEARDWARARGLAAQDEPSYVREGEHLTLARLLIAEYRANHDESTIREASDLLARLLTTAEAGGRTGSVNEILVLQALAHAALGHTPQAVVPLERALIQAEPEGYVRLFIDEGLPMLALLQLAARREVAPTYTRQLIAAFGKWVTPPPVSRLTPAPQPLAEPLSERELEVLRLLRTELSGPEIARQLMVSLNTFNTHTKNIYSKLGVNNRLAAIRRAEELNLT